MVRNRVRIRFSKQGDLRWIGHRDLMRCMERMFRRAELPLGMSEGFHPKPRMTFPLALAVGIEAIDEVMELELTEPLPAEEVLARLAPCLPPGLSLNSAELLPEGSRKAHVGGAAYEAPIPSNRREGLAERIDRLMAGSSCPVERARGRAAIDLRPLVEELELREGVLRMRLRVSAEQSAGAREVLTALELADLEHEGVCMRRTAVEIER